MAKIDKIMAYAGLEPFPIAELPKRPLLGNQFFVRLDGNKLVIDRNLYEQNVRDISVGRARYSGTNRGEKGGYLSGRTSLPECLYMGSFERRINRRRGARRIFMTGDGNASDARSDLLVSGHIVHLQLWQDDLYIFEGLDHMGLCRGLVSVIKGAAEPSKPQVITLLPQAPRLVCLDSAESRFFIVSSSGLTSLRDLSRLGLSSGSGPASISDWYLEPLSVGAFWYPYLAPTSIARFKDYVLIGLPFGVAVHSTRGPLHNFYGDAKTLRQLNPTG
ncbi:MAG: hypothetical protein GX569_05035 [Candidatus Riflebacteria bacterium]|nr:hypothetical protein [Candidatus Riflebacteria bacterium]